MTVPKIALLVAASFLVPASAQEIKVDLRGDTGPGSGYFDKWDPVADRLILYHDVSTPNSAAVKMISPTDGSSTSVFPLRDLPDAQRMTVWDAAATPDAGVVVSVIAEYGPRETKPVPIKLLLLIYDSAGNLRKVWDTAPYHHRLVAADKEGNIFGFGSGDSSNKKSPLLVKYSPDGRVLREFLPADTFGLGDQAVSSSSRYGKSDMFVDQDKLDLWLAPPQELMEFSLDGKVMKRFQLGPVINRLKDSLGVGGLEVSRASMAKDGELVCEVILWPNVKGQKAKFAIMGVAKGDSQARLLSAASEKRIPGSFVGVNSAGKTVFLEDVHGDFGTYRTH